MKKTTITITFDEEKLSALKIYLEQKNQTAEEELEAALAALYNKTVPAGVREYLKWQPKKFLMSMRRWNSI